MNCPNASETIPVHYQYSMIRVTKVRFPSQLSKTREVTISLVDLSIWEVFLEFTLEVSLHVLFYRLTDLLPTTLLSIHPTYTRIALVWWYAIVLGSFGEANAQEDNTQKNN